MDNPEALVTFIRWKLVAFILILLCKGFGLLAFYITSGTSELYGKGNTGQILMYGNLRTGWYLGTNQLMSVVLDLIATRSQRH